MKRSAANRREEPVTTLRFFTDAGTLVGIEAQGHSGTAPRGDNLVCLALSILVQTLELGVEEVLRVPGAQVTVDPENTLRRVLWDRTEDPGMEALSTTIRRALETVAEAHPKQVRIVEVERDEAQV